MTRFHLSFDLDHFPFKDHQRVINIADDFTLSQGIDMDLFQNSLCKQGGVILVQRGASLHATGSAANAVGARSLFPLRYYMTIFDHAAH